MIRNKLMILLGAGMLLASSCGKEFLQKLPQGELAEPQVGNSDGVEGALIGAYSILNGNISGTWGHYGSAPSQWVFGELASDNAHKGSELTDQTPMNEIEAYGTISTNDNLSTMWQVYFEGVLRCNNTLKLLNADQTGAQEVSADRAIEIQAESRMLRAHYYFYLWRVFRNVPLITEEMTTEEAQTIPNDQDILPFVEEDLKFAIENLPETKINEEYGRMDKATAQAYLGKLYLYQQKFPEALVLFKQVMAGKDLVAMPFWNNFDVTQENGPEVVMASKHAINDNGSSDNANVGDMLSGLYGSSPVGCCGFYQPSIDLVNAYRVDANGLPFLNGEYREDPYTSDLGKADNSYELDVQLKFDPRLDYTVGRRGVSYLDYGIMPGNGWIRDANYAGPFVGIKTMVPQSQFANETAPGEKYVTGLDVNIIRLADVWLMAAECEVEAGNLSGAMELVNDVRKRAANLAPKKTADGANAADYTVEPYASFPNAEYAKDAVRFERRLELALEGHRFFDLVRWGIAKETIESYSTFEGGFLPSYKGLTFSEKDEYWPIPQAEIDRSNGVLKQN
ncbi:RagB/SusD family nutrient uptake outer membrane protein [Sphingobacterium sp. JB170]|uniref:RagB/SusD family nutrient uptake outer membrane protein n=1 Tax=Sphingobacterium sp. JB170 TaxID=1434842 RepID=UPI00097EE800|nr:RagB/SusD family nutrient uptake outer membrane protein [Sphingobacterium sp. JB170]SJN23620.1 putative outer membrane protein, probably involved in nutrient binding [Sphingobacterium sp. JB170]